MAIILLGMREEDRKWRKSAICILQKYTNVLQDLIYMYKLL